MLKKIIKILSILLLPIIVIFLFNKLGLLYGSQTDWINQHIIYADYFRELFYKTGNIIPEFSLNIGAGQNIFNFAYYGLLNPIILLSYMLPFVRMDHYITYTIILSIMTTFILIKKWLTNNNYDKKLSLTISILFILSGPIIFHTHRHIMFINYFPFLILGLIAIDKYYKEKRSWLIILSIFLIIMISYYYSVVSLITLFSYALYKYLKDHTHLVTSDLTQYIVKTTGNFLLGIMISVFFLLPIIGVILNGRSEFNTGIKVINLLIPNFNIEYILYDSYSTGLTVIALLSIIYSFISKKKENILLSIIVIVLTSIPLFMYVLNGGLYIRAKALIPLLPLILLLIVDYLKDFNVKKSILILLVFLVISLFFKYSNIIFYIDIMILILFLIKSQKCHNKIIYGLLFIVPLINVYNVNKNEEFVKISDYNNYFNNNEQILINNITLNDKSFYRINNLNDTLQNINKVYNSNHYSTSIYSSTYNKTYHNFYYKIFNNAFPDRNLIMLSQSNNILFQTLMGVKYIVSDKESPVGYRLIDKIGSTSLYQNDNVFPLGYINSSHISKKYFDELEFPYNVEALMNKVIIDDPIYDDISDSKIKEVKLEYEMFNGDDIQIEKIDNQLIINSHSSSNMILELKEPIKNNVLIINFDILESQNCKKGDLSITINDIKNTLTCENWIYSNNHYNFSYVISSNEDIDKLRISFTKGLFKIDNIKTYLWAYDDIKKLSSDIDQFNIDVSRTSGNKIYGDIKVKRAGYFVLNIPYDKGFKIKVNSKNQTYEKINNSFIGFHLDEGEYEIEIIYHTPLLKEGLIISVMGFIIYGYMIFKERSIKDNE